MIRLLIYGITSKLTSYEQTDVVPVYFSGNYKQHRHFYSKTSRINEGNHTQGLFVSCNTPLLKPNHTIEKQNFNPVPPTQVGLIIANIFKILYNCTNEGGLGGVLERPLRVLIRQGK